MNKFVRILVSLVPSFLAVGVQLAVSMVGIVVVMMSVLVASPEVVDDEGMIIMDIFMEKYMQALSGDTLLYLMVVAYGLSIIIFGLVYFFVYTRKYPTRFKSSFPPQVIFSILFLGVALQIGISMVLEMIAPLIPDIMSSYEELLGSLQLGDGFVPMLLVGILAPISEELVFRGITIRILKPAIPLIWINLLQAFLFGVYHMNPIQFVYAFLMGLVLGAIAIHFDSIWPTILLHATVNLSGNFLEYILPDAAGSTIGSCVLWTVISAVIIVPALIIIMKTKPELEGVKGKKE